MVNVQTSTWYRISFYCGLTPLIFGVAIYVAWYFTRENWLEAAGLINIFLGFCLFCLGILSLGVYVYKENKANSSGYLKRCLLPLFVLLINFPVAGAIIDSANFIKTTFTVSIKNDSNIPITDFVLSERDKSYKVDILPAGGAVKQEFHFIYEGSVYYHFSLNGKKYEGIMFGYVSHHGGSNAVMVISEDRKVLVKENFRDN